MTRDEVLAKFSALNVWKRGDQRAPHKPLLVLWALGRLACGEQAFAYRDLDEPLKDLLREFGPVRKSDHPEYPFWRLQKDRVWEVCGADDLKRRSDDKEVLRSELLTHDVRARFAPAVAEALAADPRLVSDLAQQLLHAHFPVSLHDDIASAVGLSLAPVLETVERRKRASDFRARVLTAYGHRCAVCGFEVRLGARVFGLEAAHIKWHQAKGPDTESNGLALCLLHHKALDMGVVTILPERVVVVSERACGTSGLEEHLLRFHDRPIREPVRSSYMPNQAYLAWHREEVFKGPAREQCA